MKETVKIVGTISVLALLGLRAAAQPVFTYDLPGNLTTESNVFIAAPPVFQQTAQYLIAQSNGLLSVSVPVTGAGPFTYQWLFNGVAVAGATNDSFQLANALAVNLGNYQLVAANSAGAVTSAAVNVSFDTDQSGLPDAWQIRYFGHLGVDPNADPENDGVSNYQSYLDGTNPTNASSVMPRLYLYSTAGGTASATPVKAKYQLGDLVQITAVANPGNAFIGWSGSITNTNTTVNLVMNSTKTITANFGLPLAQVLDAPKLVWTTGGDRAWFGQTNTTFDGVSAAQSGVALVGQQSWVQTTVSSTNLVEIAFDWAVSSEQFTNFLDFNVNGNPFGSISGGQGQIVWLSQTFLIPPGTNTLSWVYAQNVADNDTGWIDLDTGWLDQVHVAPLVIARGSSAVVAWGDNANGQTTVPSGLTNVVGLAAGEYHSVALKSDGTVVAWGYNVDGETNVPSAATNVMAVASGWFHNLALKRDGTVVVWGNNDYGQTAVPPGLSNVTAVAGGGYHSLALKHDGTVVAWGDDSFGQTAVPPGLSNVAAIAGGGYFSLALKSDGTVVAWGDNSFAPTNMPSSLSNVAGIAAGEYFGLALQSDGTVVAWGNDSYGQTNIASSLSNVAAIAAGIYHGLALESDGAIAAWGDNAYNQTNVPTIPLGLGNFVAVAGGGYHALALLGDGTPFIARELVDQTVYSGTTAIFTAGAAGKAPLSYQWRFNGTNLAGATNASLILTNVQLINTGPYSVVVSNSLGTLASSNATLTVIHSAPIITIQPASEALVAGQSGGFSATAVGSLPLSYQWLFKGTNVAGATSSVLVLLNVTTNQAGAYQLLVTNVYGSATSAVVTLAVASTSSGVVFSTVYAFGTIHDATRNSLDGANPYAALVLGANGSLYGTTVGGGSNVNGSGTVFRMTATGALTSLYSFGTIQDAFGDPLDGAHPYDALMLAADGSVYGTTSAGGSNIGGFGTVFRVSATGALTSLYSFGTIQDASGNPLDGANPYAALLLGADGGMYGTTFGGGSNGGFGTVFRITTNGALTSLYSFGAIQDASGDPLDGANPYTALILGTNGSLYGTTYSGGSYFSSFGTVFRITTNGTLTSLYSFGTILDAHGNPVDGAYPYAPLLLGADGRMYGTTFGGGSNINAYGSGFGTVFRMTANGALTSLYSFGSIQDTNGYALDGASPEGGLVQGSDGNFYGTTTAGGANNNGTLFRITPSGVFTTLYRFSGGSDGATPSGGLIQGSDGSFYGTTAYGGTNGAGTIFRFATSGSPPPPLIQSVVHANGTLTFSWSAVAGQTYQVQYTANLNQTTWSNLGASIVAAGATVSASDVISNAQRFYRVVLLP